MPRRVVIPSGEIARLADRLRPTPAAASRLARLLLDQVHARYDTQGASGGVAWPPKRGGGPALLGLRDTWTARSDGKGAELATGHPHARRHQLGTVGKGGVLPTIVPRGGRRALFIPLTDRARRSGPLGSPPLRVVRGNGGTFLERAVTTFEPLVKGVDFVFARKVDLPPRPQLPTGAAERAATAAALADAIRRPPKE